MLLEVLGGMAIGALLSGRRVQRSTVYIEREPEVRLPVYHPPLLPRVPSYRELAAVKHGHQFCPWNLRCACGLWVNEYMGYFEQDLCPFILRRSGDMGTMRVIDIPCKHLPDGFGTGKLTTIVSKDLKSKVRQVERLHGVKFDHILFDNHRMRVFFRVEDESLADTRQTILCR